MLLLGQLRDQPTGRPHPVSRYRRSAGWAAGSGPCSAAAALSPFGAVTPPATSGVGVAGVLAVPRPPPLPPLPPFADPGPSPRPPPPLPFPFPLLPPLPPALPLRGPWG